MFQEIIKFWFEDSEQSQWFSKDANFDDVIRHKYLKLHAQAAKCELFKWRTFPEGRLAEIIILDQFSRNIFRDSPSSFAFDALALSLAQEAIAVGVDQMLTSVQKSFLYMPFMHSESSKIHDVALKLYKDNGLASNLEFEEKHKLIIDRFGRYPHRNAILGRVSTKEEVEFLKLPNSGF